MTTSPTTPEQTPSTVDIAVIGAGIAGLATAVALRHAGFDAHVFERTPVFSEVGSSVVIREPAVRLFDSWGLHGFHDQAVPFDLIEVRDKTGAVLKVSRADVIGDGQSYSTHRHDIHALLAGALPADRIHLGHTSVSVTNDDDGKHATIAFADGTHVSAPLVVGADGIRSVARKALVEDEAVFAGLVSLRGMAPASALPADATNDRLTQWSDGHHVLLGLPLRGGRMIGFSVGIMQDVPPQDLWNAEVPTSDLLELFADFDHSVRDIIAAGTVPVLAHPVYDREPIFEWVSGRIVLVGDAAHPMSPRFGQGANQAIQDAGALADGLTRFGLPGLEDALKSYQDVRVGPATALQTASRHMPDMPDIRTPPTH